DAQAEDGRGRVAVRVSFRCVSDRDVDGPAVAAGGAVVSGRSGEEVEDVALVAGLAADRFPEDAVRVLAERLDGGAVRTDGDVAPVAAVAGRAGVIPKGPVRVAAGACRAAEALGHDASRMGALGRYVVRVGERDVAALSGRAAVAAVLVETV